MITRRGRLLATTAAGTSITVVVARAIDLARTDPGAVTLAGLFAAVIAVGFVAWQRAERENARRRTVVHIGPYRAHRAQQSRSTTR